MKTAGQQARLDLHQLDVDLAHQGIPLFSSHLLGLLLRQFQVAIEVHQAALVHNRVDDGNAAPAILQGLVRANQLAQFLQAFVKTGIFCGRGQVRNGFGIAATLRNRRFAGIVGCVVIEVGNVADEVIGIAVARHAHLFPRHEL